MPVPDRIPSPRASMKNRFWRVFRLLALLATIVGAIAAILVSRGDSTVHIHMMIATFLGAGLTFLLGTSLMTLTFLSSSSGHDDDAGHSHQENDRQ